MFTIPSVTSNAPGGVGGRFERALAYVCVAGASLAAAGGTAVGTSKSNAESSILFLYWAAQMGRQMGRQRGGVESVNDMLAVQIPRNMHGRINFERVSNPVFGWGCNVA